MTEQKSETPDLFPMALATEFPLPIAILSLILFALGCLFAWFMA